MRTIDALAPKWDMHLSPLQYSYWPVPSHHGHGSLYITYITSLSINHKIVFLTPPLVPILRSNNDPEVLWIVARRGAHGGQVRGGGGQGSFCGHGEVENFFTILDWSTQPPGHLLGVWRMDMRTRRQKNGILRKGFNLFLSLFYLNKMNVALIKSGELLARRLATVELSTRLREVSKFLENDPMTAVSFLVYLLSLNAYLA